MLHGHLISCLCPFNKPPVYLQPIEWATLELKLSEGCLTEERAYPFLLHLVLLTVNHSIAGDAICTCTCLIRLSWVICNPCLLSFWTRSFLLYMSYTLIWILALKARSTDKITDCSWAYSLRQALQVSSHPDYLFWPRLSTPALGGCPALTLPSFNASEAGVGISSGCKNRKMLFTLFSTSLWIPLGPPFLSETAEERSALQMGRWRGPKKNPQPSPSNLHCDYKDQGWPRCLEKVEDHGEMQAVNRGKCPTSSALPRGESSLYGPAWSSGAAEAAAEKMCKMNIDRNYLWPSVDPTLICLSTFRWDRDQMTLGFCIHFNWVVQFLDEAGLRQWKDCKSMGNL